VTEAIVSVFAIMEPQKKIAAHCHCLLSCRNTKTEGCHRLLHYTTTKKKKKKVNLLLLPSELQQKEKKRSDNSRCLLCYNKKEGANNLFLYIATKKK